MVVFIFHFIFNKILGVLQMIGGNRYANLVEIVVAIVMPLYAIFTLKKYLKSPKKKYGGRRGYVLLDFKCHYIPGFSTPTRPDDFNNPPSHNNHPLIRFCVHII